MTPTKHTPGPWTTWEAYELSALFAAPVTSCAVRDHSLSPATATAWGNTKEEAEANAKLIAAAPDLARALKMAVAWLQNTNARFDRMPRGIAGTGELKDILERAGY